MISAPLSRTLRANPNISTWLGFAEAGTVEVRSGKVELGQGILSALARIVADELDVAIDQVLMAPASTDAGPDEGLTAGSLSVQDSGEALRQVCAEARAALLDAVAAKLAVAVDDLTVAEGTVTAGDGRSMTYWDIDPDVLDRDVEGLVEPKPPKPPEPGATTARLDLPDKVYGRPRFIHDLRLPRLLHGRVVRAPARGAVLAGLEPVELPFGVTAVRDGSFLGVVAAREEVAIDAAATVADAAHWQLPVEPLPDEDDLPTWLRAGAAVTTTLNGPATDGRPPVAEVRTSYSRPYLAHGSIAPSCGIAVWEGDSVRVWSHTQGIHPLRGAIAAALGLERSAVAVEHVEGAGAYGHNGADDAAFDAVLLAKAVPGRPVRVLWSRADELAAGPLGPAMVVDVTAGVDAAGDVVSWRHETWSQGHTARPGYAGTPGLLAAAAMTGGMPPVPSVDPPAPAHGALRNAEPIYAFPDRTVLGHRVLATEPRASAIRGLGAFLNVVAIEGTMDELAARAGCDPVAYRLRHLDDQRARDVLERAAANAGWADRQGGDEVGHGIAVARYKGTGAYCAVVAEVEAVHEVVVRRLVVAVDVGRVVSLDGVVNQIEGGAVQATSWTLRERVRFDRSTITSTDWETYPILRFSEVPPVSVEVIDQLLLPSLGAGEAAQGPTAAAIVNALRDVLGVAVRDLPLTAERVAGALS
ncbi:molybdopterin cofactor-binding domain-containing protein [Pseudonocardia sp. TRM90224]|uniref:molybdopterin cofactor-binding domain-containing protein n=1 Tax=Pseudonocardia sp. TRM90224 TaxID=2812678 RepID=UPI001E341E47|nr:molybdopterin cofactor-binding domain-containing protein [Pseudonocardia sp. TRM90224]